MAKSSKTTFQSECWQGISKNILTREYSLIYLEIPMFLTVQGCLFILVTAVYKLNVSKDSLVSHLYCTVGYQIGRKSFCKLDQTEVWIFTKDAFFFCCQFLSGQMYNIFGCCISIILFLFTSISFSGYPWRRVVAATAGTLSASKNKTSSGTVHALGVRDWRTLPWSN